jgi:hypothetical protein
MLIVTIDLLPGGHAPHRRTVASMQIANVTELADVSDYHVGAIEGANPLTGTPPRSATCTVTSHDRRQSIWNLLARAAEAAMKADYDEL